MPIEHKDYKKKKKSKRHVQRVLYLYTLEEKKQQNCSELTELNCAIYATKPKSLSQYKSLYIIQITVYCNINKNSHLKHGCFGSLMNNSFVLNEIKSFRIEKSIKILYRNNIYTVFCVYFTIHALLYVDKNIIENNSYPNNFRNTHVHKPY